MHSRDLSMLDAVRQQITRGEIAGITFWPVDGGWQVNVRRPSGGWAVIVGTDPFTALHEAVSPTVFRVKPVEEFEDLLG